MLFLCCLVIIEKKIFFSLTTLTTTLFYETETKDKKCFPVCIHVDGSFDIAFIFSSYV